MQKPPGKGVPGGSVLTRSAAASVEAHQNSGHRPIAAAVGLS